MDKFTVFAMLKNYCRWRWLFVGTSAIAVFALFCLYLTALANKEVGFFAKIVLLLISLAGIAATWIAGGQIVEPGKGVAGLATPKATSLLILAAFGVFGTLTDVYGFLQPRTATRAETDAIKTDTSEILKIIAPDTTESLSLLRNISGRWGERGCKIRYDIHAEDRSITMKEVGNDYRSVSAIELSNSSTLLLTTLEPASDRGAAVQLVYETNGTFETLTVEDKRSEVPMILDRGS